jgi:hypothetical protein
LPEAFAQIEVLLEIVAVVTLGPEMMVLDIAGLASASEASFEAASSFGSSSFSRATSARSFCAVSSSLLFFAAPISREAALRRASAASAF